MSKISQTAEAVREFNRFYLPYFRLISQKYLNSDHSVIEARVIYEIFSEEMISAHDIVEKIHIDKSYLSRMLKKFEAGGFVERKESAEDSRRYLISLTERGKLLSEKLIAESTMQIERELKGISDDNLNKLSYHMAGIIKILEDRKNGDR